MKRRGTPIQHERLRRAREERGWSQTRLADLVGTSVATVRAWERGQQAPNLQNVSLLSALFDSSAEELGLARGAAAATYPPSAAGSLLDPSIPLPFPKATDLVGRDALLADLKARLLGGGNLLLCACNGLPGVGKTTVAIALAHDEVVRAHYTDGVLWAGLGPHPNISGHLARWGMLLGIPATTMARLAPNPEACALELCAAIGQRRLLVVIDDAWSISDARAFLLGGPNCAYLLTTRFPTVATLFAPEGIALVTELALEDGLALLERLAPRAVQEDRDGAASLVRAVGGLPLALTLMGHALRNGVYGGTDSTLHLLRMTTERLKIEQPRDRTESHPYLTPETPLSLQTVIGASVEALDRAVRQALYSLAAFPAKPHTFSETAAIAVAQCASAQLDRLCDAGLLESGGPGRYTLHQTVADYARLQPRDPAAEMRLVAFFAGYAAEHEADFEAVEQECANVLRALETAFEQQAFELLLRIIGPFTGFLEARGLYGLADLHLSRSLEAARALRDWGALAYILLHLGEISQKQGAYDKAESLYLQGLELARQSHQPRHVCGLLSNLGWVEEKRGNYAQAEAYLREGLALARRHGYLDHQCTLLRGLGSVVSRRGAFAEAKSYYLEGLGLAQRLADRELLCILLLNLGVVEFEQGHDDALVEAYQQRALELARQLVHHEWTSLLLMNLGVVATERGNYAQAEAYLREGLTLARRIEQREWTGHLLLNLGWCAAERGNYAQAEAYYQEGLALARQLGKPQLTCELLYYWGEVALKQHKVEVAATAFQEMRERVPEGGEVQIAQAQFGLARMAAASGRPEEALELGQTSLHSLEAMDHRMVREVRQWLSPLLLDEA